MFTNKSQVFFFYIKVKFTSGSFRPCASTDRAMFRFCGHSSSSGGGRSCSSGKGMLEGLVTAVVEVGEVYKRVVFESGEVEVVVGDGMFDSVKVVSSSS